MAAAEITKIKQDLSGLSEVCLKKKLRGLQLVWHPDKAKGHADVAHRVFCFIQETWEESFK